MRKMKFVFALLLMCAFTSSAFAGATYRLIIETGDNSVDERSASFTNVWMTPSFQKYGKSLYASKDYDFKGEGQVAYLFDKPGDYKVIFRTLSGEEKHVGFSFSAQKKETRVKMPYLAKPYKAKVDMLADLKEGDTIFFLHERVMLSCGYMYMPERYCITKSEGKVFAAMDKNMRSSAFIGEKVKMDQKYEFVELSEAAVAELKKFMKMTQTEADALNKKHKEEDKMGMSNYEIPTTIVFQVGKKVHTYQVFDDSIVFTNEMHKAMFEKK